MTMNTEKLVPFVPSLHIFAYDRWGEYCNTLIKIQACLMLLTFHMIACSMLIQIIRSNVHNINVMKVALLLVWRIKNFLAVCDPEDKTLHRVHENKPCINVSR